MSTSSNNRSSSHASFVGSRRRFLKSVGAGAAGIGLPMGLSAASYAKVRGANERVRIGVIGVRGMGYGHVQGYSALDGVEVAAICDVDESILAQRLASMPFGGGGDSRRRNLPRRRDVPAILQSAH